MAAAYAGSLHGGFVFDDIPSLLGNSTLRAPLWPPWTALHPIHGDGWTVEGRPVLNLSFAINYALGHYEVWGWHLANVAIHAGCALTLFGVLRRTGVADTAAGAAALLWAVHPLCTEAVSYLSQRAESLMALFYLQTLYWFARSTQTNGVRQTACLVASIALCACGMGTKEVMVSSPLIVFLYDRAFVSGSVAAAWRVRKGYYLGLAATWLVLAFLVAGSGSRGGTVGAGGFLSRGTYLAAQLHGLVHYVRLVFWPAPLIFDYGASDPQPIAARILCAALVLAWIGIVLFGLRRNTAWGWAGAAFFAILGPSSSVIPIRRQILAEHRMYLPAAIVISLAVVWLFRRVERPRARIAATAALALALGATTFARNRVYESETTLFADCVAKRPSNPYAQVNWAVTEYRRGDVEAARQRLLRAVALEPENPDVHFALGTELAHEDRLRDARRELREAVRLHCDNPQAEENLDNVEERLARADYNQAYALAASHRAAEAIPLLREAVDARPNFPEAHLNLANALASSGRYAEAIAEYDRALAQEPGLENAKKGRALASQLLTAGR